MKTEDIDKIIAEALEEEKNKKRGGKRRWNKGPSKSKSLGKVRMVLNVLFMLGFLAAVIIYFAFPEQRTLFFAVGFGSMLLKIVEFALRFLF